MTETDNFLREIQDKIALKDRIKELESENSKLRRLIEPAVRAGIYDEQGKLLPPYASEEPSAVEAPESPELVKLKEKYWTSERWGMSKDEVIVNARLYIAELERR